MRHEWRSNVRFDPLMGEEGTFLMRCEQCATNNKTTAFFPITKEFWTPYAGLQRCRACHQANRRRNHKLTIEERRARGRRHYQNSRENRLAYARTYLEHHRDHINAKRRERYAKRKQERAA